MDSQNKAFHAIQAALAGHSEKEVIGALTASLTIAIGVASESIIAANEVIDQLPRDMKRMLLGQWTRLRSHRDEATRRSAH